MNILPITSAQVVPGDYVGIYMQGLYGDTVLATCFFEHIIEKYPTSKWIIVHTYRDLARLQGVIDLLRAQVSSGRIEHYFHYAADCIPMPEQARAIFAAAGVHEVFDLLAYHAPKEFRRTPSLGIDLNAPKIPNKAIICRYSGWHGHFPERNRPFEEWDIIEKTLLSQGYTVYLTGYDDPMPNPNGLVDLRKSLSVYDTLDFSKDASLCITPLTFLYVFTQYTCTTLVLSPPSHTSQFDTFKTTDKLIPINLDGGHLDRILQNIPPLL